MSSRICSAITLCKSSSNQVWCSHLFVACELKKIIHNPLSLPHKLKYFFPTKSKIISEPLRFENPLEHIFSHPSLPSNVFRKLNHWIITSVVWGVWRISWTPLGVYTACEVHLTTAAWLQMWSHWIGAYYLKICFLLPLSKTFPFLAN